jgi:hypothetical protein
MNEKMVTLFGGCFPAFYGAEGGYVSLSDCFIVLIVL